MKETSNAMTQPFDTFSDIFSFAHDASKVINSQILKYKYENVIIDFDILHISQIKTFYFKR